MQDTYVGDRLRAGVCERWWVRGRPAGPALTAVCMMIHKRMQLQGAPTRVTPHVCDM